MDSREGKEDDGCVVRLLVETCFLPVRMTGQRQKCVVVSLWYECVVQVKATWCAVVFFGMIHTSPIDYRQDQSTTMSRSVCVCCDTKVTNRRESSRKLCFGASCPKAVAFFIVPALSPHAMPSIHCIHIGREAHTLVIPSTSTDRCYTQTQQNKACPPPPPPLLGNWSRARGVKFSWLCVPNNARPTEQPAFADSSDSSSMSVVRTRLTVYKKSEPTTTDSFFFLTTHIHTPLLEMKPV